jgi:hypothetical protein
MESRNVQGANRKNDYLVDTLKAQDTGTSTTVLDRGHSKDSGRASGALLLTAMTASAINLDLCLSVYQQ